MLAPSYLAPVFNLRPWAVAMLMPYSELYLASAQALQAVHGVPYEALLLSCVAAGLALAVPCLWLHRNRCSMLCLRVLCTCWVYLNYSMWQTGAHSSRWADLKFTAKYRKKKWRRLLCSGAVVMHYERGWGDFMAITCLLHGVPALCKLFAAYPRFTNSYCAGNMCWDAAALCWCMLCVCPMHLVLQCCGKVLTHAMGMLEVLLLLLGLDLDRLVSLSRRRQKVMRNGAPMPAGATRTRLKPLWSRIAYNVAAACFFAASCSTHAAPLLACVRPRLFLQHLLVQHCANWLKCGVSDHCAPAQLHYRATPEPSGTCVLS